MSGGTVYGSINKDTTMDPVVNANEVKDSAGTIQENKGAALYVDSGLAQYGKAGSYTSFGTAPANRGLTEDGNKGTSRTLSVNPDTGALTVRPNN